MCLVCLNMVCYSNFSNKMSEKNEYLCQPAKMLLVDLSAGSILDNEMCRTLVIVLKNYFSLVCSMNGPSRLVFFGVIAIGTNGRIEVLLPMQHIRANFVRIQSTLNDLQMLSDEWTASENVSGSEKVKSALFQGINESVAMFKRQAQGLLMAAGYWSQIEIIVFTSQSIDSMLPSLNAAAKTLDTQSIKKIQVVKVSNSVPELGMLKEQLNAASDKESTMTSDPSSNDVSELIELHNLNLDQLSLQNFFMQWLHDSSTDQEHLHISFDKGLTLKCDVQERMLSSVYFASFYQDYHLSRMDAQLKVIASGSGLKSTTRSGPKIMHLNVVSRVPVETICDSLTFGNPLIVRRTSCWKLDWDELETNQQNFQALCHLLKERSEVLITRLSDDQATDDGMYGLYPGDSRSDTSPTSNKPRGYFVLMPSPKCTLLLKSIVGSELLLPIEFPPMEKPTEKSLSVMSESLDHIEAASSYNPLVMNTDLYSSLFTQLTANCSTVCVKRRKV